MKKTIFAIFCVVVLLTGCVGNHEIVEFKHQFDYVIFKLPNGEIIEGELEAWSDYEGEQLQVKVEGKTYIVSSYNCVLIRNENTGVQF